MQKEDSLINVLYLKMHVQVIPSSPGTYSCELKEVLTFVLLLRLQQQSLEQQLMEKKPR